MRRAKKSCYNSDYSMTICEGGKQKICIFVLQIMDVSKMKKILFLLALPLFMTGCFETGSNTENQTSKGTTESGNVVVKNEKSDFSGTIAFLSVNDMHSNIDRMPRLAYVVDSLRKIYPDLIVLSAGDNRTGNPVNDQYEPTSYPMIDLMNEVGFEASALGNHEFDAGIPALKRNIDDAKFDFLCANIHFDNGDIGVKPYKIIDKGGCKIAVVGMVQIGKSGLPSAHPDNLKGVRFDDGIELAKKYKNLKDDNNIVILLSHIGFEDDYEIADRCPFYDAILGGHSHTLVEKPSQRNGVLVTQAGSKLNYATLTLMKLTNGQVTEKSAVTLSLEKGKIDSKVKQKVDYYNQNSALNDVIAFAVTDFTEKEEIGSFMADALLDGTGADFAFQNPGGVRKSSLRKGDLTMKDIYSIDPFENEVVVYKMTGAQVKHFIIESYKRNGREPSFVSGMTYEITVAGDGYPKSVYVTADKGNFSTKNEYKVAMNSYMATTVQFEAQDDGESMFVNTDELIVKYAKKLNKLNYRGVRRVEVKR